MSSLHRAAFSVALTVAPVLAMGCAQMSRQTVCRPPVASAPAANLAAQPVGDGTMNLARQEEGRGNFAQARRLYEDVYRREPGNVECAHRLGVVCTRLNLPQDAENYLRQAYAKTPSDAELLADMGYASFMKQDYAQAEVLLEQSVKLNGSNPRSINNLAIARAWCGKDESSLALFRTANSEIEAQRRLQAIQVARADQNRSRQIPALQTPAQSIELPPAPSMKQSAPEFLARYKTLELNMATNEFVLPVPMAAIRSPNDDLLIPPSPAASIELTAHTEVATTDVRIELPAAAPGPVTDRNDDLAGVFDQDVVVIPPPTAAVAASVADESVLPANERIEEIRAELVVADLVSTSENLSVVTPAVPDAVIASSTSETKPTMLTEWRKTSTAHAIPANRRPLEWHGHGVPQAALTDAALFDDKGVCRTCLVTLFEESRIASGAVTYTFEYQSRRYRFFSEEALQKFQATPQRYAPAAGGLDVVSVRNERKAIQGTLKFGLWHRQQLYLFSCRENAEAFFRDPQQFVVTD